MAMTCPAGHQSATDDFCDVCGAPIASAGTPSALTPPEALTPPPAPAAPEAGSDQGGGGPQGAKECPNCHSQNGPDSLFCEDCGYDFATGQLPPPPEQIDPISGRVLSAGQAGAPAEPATPDLSDVPWVAEVWIDRDWFAHQGAEGSCPTSGVPTVVPLREQLALIGRRSSRRNINPEIDCASDGAISHRHAEIRSKDERWLVVDLGSTNGTFIGRAGANLPDDPLPPQQPHELDDGERIYCGAWTRIVIREATDDERAGK